MTERERTSGTCLWCGRPVSEIGMGRRRRYCRQSCRQRAYEQRATTREAGLPDGAVVLTAVEVESLSDRAFQVRCAAEDVATAVAEGADAGELGRLCADLVSLARNAERIR